MANPFDFSSGAVLTAAQLNAIGSYTDVTWSPSANWSGAFGEKYFARVNDIIVVAFNYTLDATPSTSGFIITAAPVAGHTTLSGISGTGMAYDASTDTVYPIQPRTRDSGANIDFTTASGEFATMTNTKPFTFTSGDLIRTFMCYRAA